MANGIAEGNFDDATFDRTAVSLDNPDHLVIVAHNCRWRLGLVEGVEMRGSGKKLAEGRLITVPTITLAGDAYGAPHPDPAAYAKRFVGKCAQPNNRWLDPSLKRRRGL